ncbi:formate hydrogenlyase regulatory protein HycA [Klebsiella michiganensis]|nr:formate hydrogenlyase regulatory protein HycA [Klebsiella michiganensis]
MTIWELSEKADYIADRHRQHQEQWHTYCNSLVQGDNPVESASASRHELRAG